jgi:hypothetical protein
VLIKNYMCDVGDQNCLDQYNICQTVFDLCDELLEPQCKNQWCECKDFGKQCTESPEMLQCARNIRKCLLEGDRGACQEFDRKERSELDL